MHIGCKLKPVKCCSIDKYAISRGDYDGLRSSLQSLNWKELLSQYSDNINDMWHEFKRQLEDRICEFIPKIKKFSQIKKACWTRPIVRAKIHKKHRLWSRYMETRDDKIFTKYKSAKNMVSKEIKKLAKLEQQEVASQCKLNPKKFWNYINSKRKTKSAIGDLTTTDTYGVVTLLMHILMRKKQMS